MQNTSIVRKRLNDLKILSQNLKQSTQYSNQPDPSLIRAILNITKISAKEDIQRYSSQSSIILRRQQSQLQSLNSIPMKLKKTNSISQSILSKHLSKTQLINSNNNGENINQQQDQPLFPQNNLHRSKVLASSRLLRSNSPHLHNPTEHQQQIVHLRQQNIKLQVELRETKQKLRILEQKQNKKYINSDDEQQIQNNNQPYFKLNETVSLFFTRITVAQPDYLKVQYKNKNIRLTLDKIIIQKISSSYLGQSLNLENSKSLNSNIQLNLTSLLQIQYLKDNRMLLVFQESTGQQKVSLFMKFDDFQTMHRWDLGIYINFNIVCNLNTERIFDNHKLKQTFRASQHSQIEHQSLQTQQYKTQQKEALKKFLQDKKKFVQSQRHLKNIMVHKINKMRVRNKDEKSKQKEQQMNKDDKSDKLLKFKQDINKQINQTQRLQPEKQKQKIDQIANNDVQHILIMAEQKQQIAKNNQDETNRSKALQQERLKKIRQQQQTKLQHKRRILSAINLLKKGMYLTKYAKSAFNPHQKKVFISDDYQKLCWQNKDSTDIKFVLTSQIESMQRGQIGPGVQKHVGSKKIQDPKCFITIKTNHKDRKIIEFGMKSISLMDEFSESLQLFVSEFKKGNLHNIRQ